MTINSTIRKAGPFIGNGTASSFPFTYKVFQASDLDVVRLDQSTNVQTTLQLTTDYTVTLNQDQDSNPGGTVTLVAGPLATGYTLTMTSDVPNLQPTDLTNQGGFYPEVINDALDRATIQIQQLQEQTDRSLKVALSSDVDATLPPPNPNDLIGWDATGEALTNVDPGSLATVVAYATAYCDVFVGNGITTSWTLTRNPAVLYNLDVSINGSTQEPTRDYTLSGTTFTMTTPPPIGARVVVKYKEGLPNFNGDSQDVRYLPAGTGATARTVQSKLRDTISVKDFGAKGDWNGSSGTDDTAAIQAAITAAMSGTGANVYFPKGTYKVSSTLTIPNVVNAKAVLFGSGAVIKATHNGVLFDNQSLWVSFRDLTLSGPGKAQANSLAIQGTAYDWYLENVGIYDFQVGYRANGGVHLLQKCFFGGNGKCVWPAVFANIISVDSCYFSSSDYGIYVPNSFGPGPVTYIAQFSIYNTAMEVCGTSVYSVGINRLIVENSWFEQETIGSLVLTDTPLLSINNNYVNFPPSVSFTSGFPDASKSAIYIDPYTGTTYQNFSAGTQKPLVFDTKAYPNSGLIGIEWKGFLLGNQYTNRILGGDNRINIDTPNFWPLTDMSTYLGYIDRRWQDGYIARLHPGAGNVLWTSGSGSPEGQVTAPVGSMFTRTDGGANTTLYIKESGSGNTGWVAK